MSDNTAIAWSDHSASPWYGCAHRKFEDGSVHPGCEHCYAETMSVRNPGILGIWGEDGTRIKSKSFIRNLRRWNKIGEREGRQYSVFPSICDPFEDRPELVPWRQEMFEVIDECPFVRLLLLTKRPENVKRMWPRVSGDSVCRGGSSCTCCCLGCDCGCRDVCSVWRRSRVYRRFRNIWIGTSISDQPTADRMLPELFKLRDLTPVLFASYEPAIGPVDLVENSFWQCRKCKTSGMAAWQSCRECGQSLGFSPGLDWLLVGGESGPNRRPCEVEWFQSVADQCKEAGVPCFIKQDAAMKPGQQGRIPDELWTVKEFPKALRVSVVGKSI